MLHGLHAGEGDADGQGLLGPLGDAERRVLQAECVRSVRPAQKTTTQCRVWKPEIVEKQVECVRYVPQTITRKVPCTVCRMVPEPRTFQVPYTVCRAEQYQTTVPCCHYVAKQVPYTVTRCEPRVVTVQVPVRVCCPVPSCCGGCN